MFANYKPAKRAVLKQGATQGMELALGEELLFSAFFFLADLLFARSSQIHGRHMLQSF